MSIYALLLLASSSPAVCSLDGSQQQMNQCATQRFQVADVELNPQWKLVVALLETRDKNRNKKENSRPGYVASARAAQRAWLTFRDQHCTVAGYEARGGSMESMLVGLCREDVTRKRIEQLKALAEAYEPQ